MRIARELLVIFTISMFISGCAPDVYRVPTTFVPAVSANRKFITIENELHVRLGTGYTSVLPARSTWLRVGAIPEGDVYKIQDDVFMVEGAHRHEAYSVIREGAVVGFYLPVERAINPVSPPVAVSVK